MSYMHQRVTLLKLGNDKKYYRMPGKIIKEQTSPTQEDINSPIRTNKKGANDFKFEFNCVAEKSDDNFKFHVHFQNSAIEKNICFEIPVKIATIESCTRVISGNINSG